MTERERFIATMHYRPRDRCPIYDFNFWDETLPEWHKQGLPTWVDRVNAEDYFGVDASIAAGGETRHDSWIETSLFPHFEQTVIEDRGDHEIVQQYDGSRVLRKKYMGSIPHPISHLLTDRASWNEHFKPRLDPDNPGRIPADWDQRVNVWTDPARPYSMFLACGSLYGHLRDWMGMENLSMVIYDDPAWFEEMVTTKADCAIGVLEKVLATGARFEAAHFWEDMCYNAGPLLSPEHFKQYLVPNYRRITDLLRKYGVDVVWVDCDGKIDALIPLWLEGGVNCMFPLEIGTWGADPIRYRRQFGRDLLIMGGFDKHILQRTRTDIEREVHRLTPLVEEGGFIPMPDHRVPPDVPLENFVNYLDLAKQIWGKGIDVRPTGGVMRSVSNRS